LKVGGEWLGVLRNSVDEGGGSRRGQNYKTQGAIEIFVCRWTPPFSVSKVLIPRTYIRLCISVPLHQHHSTSGRWKEMKNGSSKAWNWLYRYPNSQAA